MKAVYITSRGGTHPIHKAYADSIGADYQYIDFKLPWHGVNSSRFTKYLSWLVCALSFPKKAEYDLFLVSGQQVMPILMKLFGQLRKDQKLVCFHANEGLYFTFSKKYGWLNRSLMKFILPRYDAHICVGKMQAELLPIISNTPKRRIFTIQNGILKSQHKLLAAALPDLSSFNIVFIGNLYAGWRSWYKGIDIMLQAVQLAREKRPEITLKIAGEYSESFRQEFSHLLGDHIQLLGKVNNVARLFQGASLYVHCGRGDAFPTTTIESMVTGTPVILSNFTGTKEIVEQIDQRLVSSLKPKEISEKILWYYDLSSEEKKAISEKGKAVATQYILEDRIVEFKKTVEKIIAS